MISTSVQVLTFDGGGAKTLAAGPNGNFRATRLLVQPLKSNTHVAYVGDKDLAIGTSTDAHVIYQLAKPTAADALLDKFDWEVSLGADLIPYEQLRFDGTSGEAVRVTIFIG